MGIHRFIFYSAKAFNPVPSSVSSLTVVNTSGCGDYIKEWKKLQKAAPVKAV